MKILLLLSILTCFSTYAQVGIGTTTPNASSVLDVSSSNKGIIIPQVTLTGTKDAITISNPANSLMVYCVGGGGLPEGYYYNKGTSASPVWARVTGDCLIWNTNVAGNYNLRTIIDVARSNNVLKPGVYNCVLKTNNAAHWSGRAFKISANLYIGNASFYHKIYDVVDVSAPNYLGGCWTGGLASFNASTGAFSFSPGVCVQSISLTCSCQGL